MANHDVSNSPVLHLNFFKKFLDKKSIVFLRCIFIQWRNKGFKKIKANVSVHCVKINVINTKDLFDKPLIAITTALLPPAPTIATF